MRNFAIMPIIEDSGTGLLDAIAISSKCLANY